MKILFVFLFISFSLVPFLSFAQENQETADKSVAEQADKKDEAKVKFSPKGTRDPFLSKEEMEARDKARRAELARIEREKKAKADAIIAAQKAEQARREREAYLKANPHLAIVNKINIQGMMGDEVQINNDFKAVGEKVLGATITKITSTKIFFKYKGKEFSMPIPQPKEYD